MKNFIEEMLSEGSKLSLMRVMSLMIVTTALGIIVYQAIACEAVDWMGCCSLVALGLGGKTGQKYLERKENTNENEKA
jgi:hypothetical protein